LYSDMNTLIAVPRSRIPAIGQVVPAVFVIDVYVVYVIPVISPVFWPGVDGTEA
jgi:hypothetical protein